MVDVHDPKTNYLAIYDELSALEWHLLDPEKRCPDCQFKHARQAHYLALEAVQLGGGDCAARLATETGAVVAALGADWQVLLAKARRVRKNAFRVIHSRDSCGHEEHD